MAKMRNVEDIYPLSPLQQGILFHALYAPDSGVYLNQTSCTLRGDLDVSAFKRAWQRVVERHSILRSFFVAGKLDKPLQVVARRVEPEWQELDWRQMEADGHEARFDAFLRADSLRGVDVARAPLMRFTLIRTADDTHRFVWSHHHILIDGWSFQLAMKELFALYEAFAKGVEAQVPRGRPFRDYIAWVQQQDMAEAEAYWRRTLAGFTTPTLVAPEAPRDDSAALREYTRETTLRVSADRTAELQAFARRHALTMNTIVQGAWSVLLGRYCGTDDVVFGVVVSGRPPALAGADAMVGLFINTLPVRASLCEDETVVDYLHGVQDGLAELQQYEYTPLVHVQGWSDIPRGQLLFDHILVFENYPIEAALERRQDRLDVENVRKLEQTNFPLSIEASIPGAQLSLNLSYDSRYFDASTVERMAGHLRVVLEDMAARPEASVGDLAILTPEERHRLTVEWNDSAITVPEGVCVHHLFEAQVAATPWALAVEADGERLTYSDLNVRANQFAHYLRSLGIGPDVCVAVLVDRSPEMLVAILGILKAGGAYIPLDPAYPAERLAYMLADARAALLVAGRGLADRAPEGPFRVVALDDAWPRIAQEATHNPSRRISVNNLAYVIYTSGSTGRPKGVGVSHSAICNRLVWGQRAYPMTAHDRVLMVTSPGFDVSVWECFGPLVAGAAIVVAPAESYQDPERLAATIAECGITVIGLVPSALRALLDREDLDRCSSLKQVFSGGEALPPDVEARFFERLPNARLYNFYGPTEAAIDATAWDCVPGVSGARVPIGKPVGNARCYVLDSWGRLVPEGFVGELCVAGAGLARGYLGNPALTAERFIPNAFGDASGERLYRTGDLARYLPDGAVDVLGRLDHQVKVRGYRIELGEIEAALVAQPGVREAVVVALDANAAGKRLVAYVTPEDGAAPGATDLREALKRELPEYMAPSAFVVLDRLPLTPSGKIDRKALPAPDPAGLASGDGGRALRTPAEQLLGDVLAQVLGVERIGLHDNFFELGGHSLLATQAVSRIRDVCGVELSLRAFFDAPTVADLVERVDRERQEARGLVAPPIRAREREGELPLSFAQQRLWFLSQMEPDSPFYNMPWAVRIRGRLDVEALESSLNAIVRRHEALRTNFAQEGGRAVQRIVLERSIQLGIADLSRLDEPEREAKALAMANADARRPFDLTRDPLLRATLLILDDEQHILLLTMHHIVSDGWSMGVLLGEIGALYPALAEGRQAALADLPVQYADFSIWQRAWLRDDVLQRQMAYWKEQLRGPLPVLDLPADRPRPPVQSFQGATASFVLDQELARGLKALGRREGATLFMTLLAGFQVLLNRYTGQDDIVVGSPIANRTRTEIEGLIGFFVNTLVLRTDLSGDPTFRRLLARVRDVVLGASSHQDLPFELLVDELHPRRDLSRNPLFQVVFHMENTPAPDLDIPGLSVSHVEAEKGTTLFDLSLQFTEMEDGLHLLVEYCTDLFDPSTVARMIGHLEAVLCGVVAAPETRISEISLVAEAEAARHALDWNAARVDYRVDSSLHRLFEEWVSRTPDAIAVSCDGEHLTYAELNQAANRLAHHLVSLGVGPETRVGIYLERTLDLVVGLLGILKAGGAYVPLDLAYPPERLAFMVEDCRAAALVTTEALLDSIPKSAASVVCLDRDADVIARCSPDAPRVELTPENLAYIIYTSGSTGRPKGTLVSHRNVVRLFDATREAFRFDHHDVWTMFHSHAFDFSVWELWGALLYGGRLVVVPYLVSRAPEAFYELLASEGVTVLNQTPSAFAQVIRAEETVGDRLASLRPLALRLVIFGGEALDPKSLAPWIRRHGDERPHLVNMYGITETTVHVTVRRIVRADLDAATRSAIGAPISDLSTYVLDANMLPAPTGVPGELYVAGAGVARGYFDRPGLTAERFVPDPYATEPGARLYRTGDLARYTPDGDLDYLGRIDSQVKIRGFRIELGEIEAAILAHPAVRENVVAVREDQPGEKRLVAYVVGEALDSGWDEGSSEALSSESVVEWRDVFNTTYGKSSGDADPTFNITGWDSSYTGQPIPAAEMREWVEGTTARILARRPRRVLEIGCGTGLLLFRVAPTCETYRATDFSRECLSRIERVVQASQISVPNLELSETTADDFRSVRPGSFDAVVLNSIVQYFPNGDYLVKVVEGAVDAVADGGFVFVGDVRNLDLLRAFHTSILLHQTPDDVSTAQLRRLVDKRVAQDEELVIAPGFFHALAARNPRIRAVRVQLRRGVFLNELTRYRYDVVLEIGGVAESAPARVEWTGEDCALPALRERLAGERPDWLVVSNLPNARLARDAAVRAWLDAADGPETVGDVRKRLDADGFDRGIDPEALWALGEDLSYDVEVVWARDDATRIDVAFRRRGAATVAARMADDVDDADRMRWRTFVNDPLQARFARRIVPKLRAALEARLPEYMVPSTFVLLDALPLTAHGKVDRRALPAPDQDRPQLGVAFVAPGTEAEKTLAGVWAEVLGIDRVGVDDNFFELGGDSILSIQVVARATQAGLSITPRQIFEHQTVASLAAVAATASVPRHEQEAVVGAVPLTPIQRWFFERDDADLHHYNQAAMFESAEPIDVAALECAVAALVEHHDALRLRFERSDAGWRSWVDAPDRSTPVSRVDLSGVPEPDRIAALEAAAADAQARFDLGAGPLVRVVVFELGAGYNERLLIVIHHLVVDAVSWRILLEDLAAAYEASVRGEALAFGRKTTSYKRWAERMIEHVRSGALDVEAGYWLDEGRVATQPIPIDDAGKENTVASERSVLVELSRDDTNALLRDVPEVYRTRINDVLLTALGTALSRWTGCNRNLVALEGHGREQILDDVDLSRTVGWFTTLCPVLLDVDPDADPGATIKHVKEQLRRVPNNGIGYGLLRYLSDDEALVERLQRLPQPEVSFNYLGQFDRASGVGSRLHLAGDDSGPAISLRHKRRFVIDFSASVVGGQLRVEVLYSDNVHRRESVEALASAFVESLRAIVTHCQSPEAGGYTPSDFPLARLAQHDLDRVIGSERGIEDVYPLTPMQHGLLFHSLQSRGGDVYFEWMSCRIEEAVDADALRGAWQAAVDRHAALRTSFVWDGWSEPLQVVRRRVELPWQELDWRRLAPEAQAERLGDFLDDNVASGFNLSKAPLLRVTLIRLGETDYQFVLSHHHLILDGWSLFRIWSDVFASYFSNREASARLLPTHPFKEYVAWLAGRDAGETETFWRERLAGYFGPSPLPGERNADPAPDDARGFATRAVVLSAEATTALQSLARDIRVTLNVLVQGAWALLLARHGGTDDVVFGATVSGRSAPVRNVEHMVGLLINTIPVRASVGDGDRVEDFLKDLHERMATAQDFEHASLVDIQGWSAVPRGMPLFESLLLFENFPVEDSVRSRNDALNAHSVESVDLTNYPLTLIAAVGQQLGLRINYATNRFDASTVDEVLDDLLAVLASFARHPASKVGDIPVRVVGSPARRATLAAPAVTSASPEASADAESFAATEAKLTGIWKDVLGIPALDPEAGFLELGGHSLLALRLAARIEVEFGVPLDIAMVYRSSGVRAMARILGARADAFDSGPVLAEARPL